MASTVSGGARGVPPMVHNADSAVPNTAFTLLYELVQAIMRGSTRCCLAPQAVVGTFGRSPKVTADLKARKLAYMQC
eukprot:15466228-Alexandrium_andersonii.AAC.1